MLYGNTILSIFEVTNSITRAQYRPELRGHFLCPVQYGGSVLLSDGESPHSPGEGLVNGKGTTVLYLVPTIKIFAMTSNLPSGKTASLVISAEEILHDLLTTDEVSRMRQHLRDMLDAFLLSEDDQISRKEIYGTFQALDFMLRKFELMEERRVA